MMSKEVYVKNQSFRDIVSVEAERIKFGPSSHQSHGLLALDVLVHPFAQLGNDLVHDGLGLEQIAIGIRRSKVLG